MTINELYSKLPDISGINPKKVRVSLITHTDLDGVSCAVILGQIFPNLFVTYVDNANMSSTIKEEIANESEEPIYDYIFVTDIAPNLEDAADIEFMAASDKLICLDHHPTSKYLKHYSWAVNCESLVDDSKVLTHYKHMLKWPGDDKMSINPMCSGTSLLLDYLLYSFDGQGLIKYRSKMIDYASIVTAWDTWAWKNVFNYDEKWIGANINKLVYLYGRRMFVKQFSDKLEKNLSYIDSEETLMIMSDNWKREEYIDEVVSEDNMVVVNVKRENLELDAVVLAVYADQYIPDVFAALQKHIDRNDAIIDGEKRKVDILAVVRANSISLRTPDSGHFDVSKFASLYGGGGHARAAGIPLYNFHKKHILEEVFNG